MWYLNIYTKTGETDQVLLKVTFFVFFLHIILENQKGVSSKPREIDSEVGKYKKQSRRKEHILKPDRKIKMKKLCQIIIWHREKQREQNTEAKCKAYEVDMRNWIQKRVREIYKLARARENKSRDIDNIRCIKSEDNRLLVRAFDIKKGERTIFTNYIMKTQFDA